MSLRYLTVLPIIFDQLFSWTPAAARPCYAQICSYSQSRCPAFHSSSFLPLVAMRQLLGHHQILLHLIFTQLVYNHHHTSADLLTFSYLLPRLHIRLPASTSSLIVTYRPTSRNAGLQVNTQRPSAGNPAPPPSIRLRIRRLTSPSSSARGRPRPNDTLPPCFSGIQLWHAAHLLNSRLT
jgi:hypothetical protein